MNRILCLIFIAVVLLNSCKKKYQKEPCVFFVPESEAQLLQNGFVKTKIKGETLERDFSRRNGDTLEMVTVDDYKLKRFWKSVYFKHGSKTREEISKELGNLFTNILIMNSYALLVKQKNVWLNIYIVDAVPNRISLTYSNYNIPINKDSIESYWLRFLKDTYPETYKDKYDSLLSVLRK
jgi:hypothetical protein